MEKIKRWNNYLQFRCHLLDIQKFALLWGGWVTLSPLHAVLITFLFCSFNTQQNLYICILYIACVQFKWGLLSFLIIWVGPLVATFRLGNYDKHTICLLIKAQRLLKWASCEEKHTMDLIETWFKNLKLKHITSVQHLMYFKSKNLVLTKPKSLILF